MQDLPTDVVDAVADACGARDAMALYATCHALRTPWTPRRVRAVALARFPDAPRTRRRWCVVQGCGNQCLSSIVWKDGQLCDRVPYCACHMDSHLLNQMDVFCIGTSTWNVTRYSRRAYVSAWSAAWGSSEE